MAAVRITLATQRVLEAFVEAARREPNNELYGAQLCRLADLGPGSTYPIVTRLLGMGWLEDRWEQDPDKILDRPLRRYYRLTATGAIEAQDALTRAAVRRQRSWSPQRGGRPELGLQ